MKRTIFVLFVVLMGITGLYTLTRSSAVHAAQTGSYNPITPTRLYDSRRDGNQKPLAGDKIRTIHVLGGSGIPHAGVSAVMLTIHAIPNGDRGTLKIYSSDGVRPSNGMIFFTAQRPASNEVLVPVGPDGSIKIYTSARVDVAIDAQGWVGIDASPTAGKLTSMDAFSVLDTTSKLGGHPRMVAKSDSVKVKVAGVGAVPATATAVVLNIAALNPAASGDMYVAPVGSAKSLSLLNITRGINSANQVIVPVGTDGQITLSSNVSRTDMVVAIEGYYSAGSDTVVTTVPALNTVKNGGSLRKDITKRLHIAGQYGVPADATGVMVHIAAIAAGADGQIRVMPYGSVPADYDAGRVNLQKAQSIMFLANSESSNSVVLPLGPDGSIGLTSTAGNVDVVVDVIGWTTTPAYQVAAPARVAVGCTVPKSTAPDSVQAARILNNTNKYAMNTWWSGAGASLLTDPLTQASARASADPVRRLSMEAFGLATSLSTCAYDASVTGVSSDVAMQRTVQLISYVASHHVSNKVDGWGGGWQGSLWTAYAGRAAWLVWGSLSPATQAQVSNMVRFEANDAAGKNIPYLRDTAGNYLRSAGDTGAETAAWYALPIQLATVMFPNDPQWPVWKYTYVQYALAAWARPSDTANQTMVNGQPISQWIDGSNVETNGIVYNHQRIAPDYMSNMYQTMDDIWVQALAGKPAPLADISLIAPVYDAYTSVLFSGKTIYTPNSAAIFYPQGSDWGTGQELPYALVDLQAATYGATGNKTLATQYQQLHAQAEATMQARFTNGQTYLSDSEYTYVGREEHTAQLAAQMYLTVYVRDNNLASFTDNDYSLRSNN